jgi:hypothetical protein
MSALNNSCVNVFLQVNNTDAEGRLTLADALVYACNQGVEKVMNYLCTYDMVCLFVYLYCTCNSSILDVNLFPRSVSENYYWLYSIRNEAICFAISLF